MVLSVWMVAMGVAQVALMGVLSSVVAAMDANRDVAAVAEHGVGFLRNLSVADANKVCDRVYGGGDTGRL